MTNQRTFVIGGKTYIISPHAWHNIRKIDIDIADVVRIIDARENMVKLKHKTEYQGCYIPRWAQREKEQKNLQVKIVESTRSTLTLKTIHNMGNCPQEEAADEGNV